MVKSQRQRHGVGTPVDVPIFRDWEKVGPLKAMQEQESQNGAAMGNDKNVTRTSNQIEFP